MPRPLSSFTDQQLLEELARRAADKAAGSDQPKRWCEACRHYRTLPRSIPIGSREEQSYNPCTKGHAMEFQMPDGYEFYDYGYYRLVCGDRSDLDEPPNGTESGSIFNSA